MSIQVINLKKFSQNRNLVVKRKIYKEQHANGLKCQASTSKENSTKKKNSMDVLL